MILISCKLYPLCTMLPKQFNTSLGKMSYIARGLSLSLPVYLSVTFVRTGRILTKNQQCNNDLCRHLPSNDVIAKIVLLHRYLLLEGQRCESRPTHSGERPFRCYECENCCTRSSFLARSFLPTTANALWSVTSSNSSVMKPILAAKQIAI